MITVKSRGRKVSDHGAEAARRDKFVREQNAEERASSGEKTARLRALRLAKEAADKEAHSPKDFHAGSPDTAQSSANAVGLT
jgi:hypothetical protein